jgi:N-acetylglucosamine-6-sulfatase
MRVSVGFTRQRDGIRVVLVSVIVAAGAVAGFTRIARAQGTPRPNILLLYVDDLRHDGLGATGHAFVETPNIDRRIADQGMNFRNSFVNCPLCSPSRASLLTGQYAVTHGYTVNDDVNAVPDERLPSYQIALRNAGYRVGHVGKWHKDSYFDPRPGFDYWVAFQGQGFHTNPTLRVKQDSEPARTVNETGFTTTILTDYALDFLNEHGAGGTRAEPFALTLSFKAVHGPHGDQYTESGGAYVGQAIRRPPNATPGYGGYDINQEKPVYSLAGLTGLTLNTTMGNSQQISQMEMMKDIDANIGRVLDALEAKGLDANTLVIFTSDNGFFWGEHGRGDKRLAYDESIRVPLLVRGPGVQRGETSDALVTNIDLAPTILTAAGLPVPRSMQGKPLNGLLSGSGGFDRDAVFAEYYPEEKQPGIQRWDAIRTETHLYVTHPEAGSQYDELYDVVNDPYQINNLLLPVPSAALPAGTRQVLRQMQTRLQELRREANGVNPFTRRLVKGSRLDFTVTGQGAVLSGLTSSRVGSNTDLPTKGSGRSAVIAYELPPIADPALLERAFVSFHILSQTGNVSRINADLWAIGITDGTTLLAEHLEADAELDLPDRADNLKLQDNIIVMGNHLARTFSDDDAAVLLAGYLRDFYEANPEYAGGSFLQVRLNPDRDPGVISAGWDISTMEAATSQADPRPYTFRQPALVIYETVPEPASTAPARPRNAAWHEVVPSPIPGSKPRSVVFILSDDHRYDAMSFLGHQFAKTPVMDSLAANGAYIKNALVTTSLCSPSRASILTGLYTFRHRVIDNNRPIPPGTVYFPQYLQQAGYATAFIGKWHMGGESDRPQPGWDHWVSFAGQGHYLPPSPDYTLNVNGRRVRQKGYITTELTDYAIDWLKQRNPGDKPFFLYLSHKAVHANFTPEAKYEDSLAHLTFERPKSESSTAVDRLKPRWLRDQRNSWHGVDFPYHSELDIERYYKRYCETLRSVDDSIGRVLRQLEEMGIHDETLVIYMGDNGFLFGEHGLIDKRVAYEPSMRVPMLAQCPDLIKAGTVLDEMIANIDIGPTVMEAMGLQKPPHMDGMSFLPLVRGETIPWRDRFLYVYYWEKNFPQTPTTFALRTPARKYITSYGLWDADELYDLESDPEEARNLVYDPASAKEVRAMENELYRMMAELGGMEIPLNQPKGGINDKRLHSRGGDEAVAFPTPMVVDEPLNHDAD